MRETNFFLWLWLLGGLTSCTKPTPGLCCTDAADCAASGIPSGQSCDDGLACRGHVCVAEVCEASSSCDATAPYCVKNNEGISGLCAATCTADAECPGAAQGADDRFCAGGACAQCRVGMNDCPAMAPTCDAGACRPCVSHGECASHVCAVDGTCADEAEIVHAAPSGSPTGDCGRLAPCTLDRALALTPARRYVLLGAGSYRTPTTLLVSGRRALIGDDTSPPAITNGSTGPIFTIDLASDVTFDHLRLTGARNSDPTNPAHAPVGQAIDCENDSGVRVVRLIDTEVFQNASAGVNATQCSVSALRSTFHDNGMAGLHVTNGTGSFDRCTFHDNTDEGLNIDSGLYTVTNSFFYRNGTGISIYPSRPGNVIELNTVVDNGTGIACVQDGTSSGSFPNNIIARNQLNADGGNGSCTYPNSIIVADVAALRFVHPDSPPYDFHITAGSIAIDQAVGSTVDDDFDGEPRPKGQARDVGADEAQ